MQKKIIIIGAGEAGKMVASEFEKDEILSKKFKILGFFDDLEIDEIKLGYRIFGKIENIGFFLQDNKKDNEIDEIIIAIPSASKDEINKIIDYISDVNIKIKIVPGIKEIIDGSFQLRQIRKIEPKDLLGREEVGFDGDKLESYYHGKTVLVTGAGGSIGSEILSLLFNLPVKKVIAFGHGENSIYNLLLKHQSERRFFYVIGDIRDHYKIEYEIKKHKVDIIFHAAAHKHVPLMEDYPDEAMINNVLGTYNLASLAIKNNVSRFVLVSTDKAINPSSVMGATKRIAEKIILSLNNYNKNCHLSLTRFGNVLGSRGSVIPLFEEQIKNGGPITITDENVTRYFMSIREAAILVIKSAIVLEGQVFVLDIGKAFRIVDLAKKMIKLYGYNENEIDIIYTGLRPGEKMHEEIYDNTDNLIPSLFKKLYVSRDREKYWNLMEIKNIVKDIKITSISYNNDKIKRLIQKLIPEYEPESNE